MSETEQDLDAIHELRFYVRRNIRYHMRRAAFFSKWSRLTAFIGVLFGSAAVAALMADLKYGAVMAIVVSISSAVDLIVGTGQRAALHNDLRRGYLGIEEDLDCLADIGALSRQKLWAKIRRLESDEPPTLPALELLSRNDVTCSMYNGADLLELRIVVPWYMRFTAHWINWDTSELGPKVQTA